MNLKKAIILSIIAALLFQFFIIAEAYRKTPLIQEVELVEEPYAQVLSPPDGRILPVKRYAETLDPNAQGKHFWFKVGECPKSSDGVKQYYCPSLNSEGRHVCIDDHQLCNGMKECPKAEDEDKSYCLFYKALKSQVQLLERSVTTLNSEARKAPVRSYSNSFGRDYYYDK